MADLLQLLPHHPVALLYGGLAFLAAVLAVVALCLDLADARERWAAYRPSARPRPSSPRTRRRP